MPLDPQAQEFLDTLRRKAAPGWNELSPREGREIFTGLIEQFGTGPELERVEDRQIPPGVPVRFYRPSADAGQPVVIYFHGGGWVLGNLDTHDALCRRLAAESGAVVVAVDYRLSPEHRYPAALDDCFAVTRFVAEQAAEFSALPARLAVMGDSAGGNLAAAVALRSRDAGGPALRGQILVYPVLDAACDCKSYHEFAEGFGLTKVVMQWFWQQYTEASPATRDPFLSPVLADDPRGLPPAHVVTAEYDVLRDEGEDYARRLKAAGVPTTLVRYDGAIHGFVHMSGIFDAGRRAISDLAAVVKSMTA